jgi:hypothetical protein
MTKNENISPKENQENQKDQENGENQKNGEKSVPSLKPDEKIQNEIPKKSLIQEQINAPKISKQILSQQKNPNISSLKEEKPKEEKPIEEKPIEKKPNINSNKKSNKKKK